MKTKFLTMTVAAVALMGYAGTANAETITTKTVVSQKEIPDVNKVNLAVFDLDKNGVLTMREVGSYLFDVFDTDGNGNVDNIEFKQKQFMTIIPMEKETTLAIDANSDGKPEVTEQTYEEFVQQSKLMRFDENKDGLSANEFIGLGYEKLDDDEDRQINHEEWQEAYLQLVLPVNEPERYN
jgi:hypothetical protein